MSLDVSEIAALT